MSDDTKTLKIPPATKADQLVMCFGADLKSNKLIVLIVQPTQILHKEHDLSFPLRSITLMQESHLETPENIWHNKKINFDLQRTS